ncbi:MAG: transglutaminase family protein [Phycisphaerales bacterium]|nr:transglutaminase family protein [Planctomycetota bacterium]MCH8507341.1 transglutaminase family protein [Phycisphaerales bacterium]
MFIRIRHTLRYDYDRPVFFEPTTVRLTPRQDTTQRLIDHRIDVTPTPDGQTWTIEQDGTSARVAWFSGKHSALQIDTDTVVQTLRENPFDALITHAPASQLPALYPPDTATALAPHLTPPTDPGLLDWAIDISEKSQHQTLPFLTNLTDWIYANCRMIMRQDGDPYTAAQTLAERSGACRDVAILFIAACRARGLAARFVSGYSIHSPPETTEQELHAWAEVYLPGAGWRGYDPSLGLATADGHVPIATAPNYPLAAPTTGSYRGTGASATMRYDITIEAAETQAKLGVHKD